MVKEHRNVTWINCIDCNAQIQLHPSNLSTDGNRRCISCDNKWKKENESYCDGCKYITWLVAKATGVRGGGGCSHPKLLKKMNHRTSFAGVPKEKPRWCFGKEHGQVMHIDTLVKKCGYFNGASPVNNGYGCEHPKQEDQEEFEGKEYGRCIRSSCTIAFPLSPNEHPEDRTFFDDAEWNKMTDGDWMFVHGVFKSGLDVKGQEFLDETMEKVDQNKDLEVALSKIDVFDGGDDGGCGSLIAQEVQDYLDGNCPHTHKKCKGDYWKEISDGVWSCTHPEDDNTICPMEKELMKNDKN